jgi:hypothetical protein
VPLAALVAALCAPAVQAEGWTPSAAFVQPAIGPNNIYSLSGGVVWPWSWKSSSGAWTGYTELLVGVWSAEAVAGGRDTFNHVAVSPIFRYNFDGGRSPWFFEGGIGMSYTSPLYVTKSKTFSTKLNFADTVGIGRSFGEGGRQSVTLRLQHLSNASIKKPNPGEEFLQLRYTWSF